MGAVAESLKYLLRIKLEELGTVT